MIINIIQTLLTFLGINILTWLIVIGAEPIQYTKHLINIANDNEYRNDFQWFFKKLFNCFLCTGFWVGVFYYQSLPIACITSLSSEIIGRLINKKLSQW